MKRRLSLFLCMTCLLSLLTSCIYTGGGAIGSSVSYGSTERQPIPTQAPETTEGQPTSEPTTPVTPPAESGSAEIPNRPDDGHTKLY